MSERSEKKHGLRAKSNQNFNERVTPETARVEAPRWLGCHPANDFKPSRTQSWPGLVLFQRVYKGRLESMFLGAEGTPGPVWGAERDTKNADPKSARRPAGPYATVEIADGVDGLNQLASFTGDHRRVVMIGRTGCTNHPRAAMARAALLAIVAHDFQNKLKPEPENEPAAARAVELAADAPAQEVVIDVRPAAPKIRVLDLGGSYGRWSEIHQLSDVYHVHCANPRFAAQPRRSHGGNTACACMSPAHCAACEGDFDVIVAVHSGYFDGVREGIARRLRAAWAARAANPAAVVPLVYMIVDPGAAPGAVLHYGEVRVAADPAGLAVYTDGRAGEPRYRHGTMEWLHRGVESFVLAGDGVEAPWHYGADWADQMEPGAVDAALTRWEEARNLQGSAVTVSYVPFTTAGGASGRDSAVFTVARGDVEPAQGGCKPAEPYPTKDELDEFVAQAVHICSTREDRRRAVWAKAGRCVTEAVDARRVTGEAAMRAQFVLFAAALRAYALAARETRVSIEQTAAAEEEADDGRMLAASLGSHTRVVKEARAHSLAQAKVAMERAERGDWLESDDFHPAAFDSTWFGVLLVLRVLASVLLEEAGAALMLSAIIAFIGDGFALQAYCGIMGAHAWLEASRRAAAEYKDPWAFHKHMAIHLGRTFFVTLVFVWEPGPAYVTALAIVAGHFAWNVAAAREAVWARRQGEAIWRNCMSTEESRLKVKPSNVQFSEKLRGVWAGIKSKVSQKAKEMVDLYTHNCGTTRAATMAYFAGRAEATWVSNWRDTSPPPQEFAPVEVPAKLNEEPAGLYALVVKKVHHPPRRQHRVPGRCVSGGIAAYPAGVIEPNLWSAVSCRWNAQVTEPYTTAVDYSAALENMEQHCRRGGASGWDQTVELRSARYWIEKPGLYNVQQRALLEEGLRKPCDDPVYRGFQKVEAVRLKRPARGRARPERAELEPQKARMVIISPPELAVRLLPAHKALDAAVRARFSADNPTALAAYQYSPLELGARHTAAVDRGVRFVVEDDGVSWDATQSGGAQWFTAVCMAAWTNANDSEDATLIYDSFYAPLRIDIGGLGEALIWLEPSGRGTTTCGNTLRRLCVAWWAMCSSDSRVGWELWAAGDDGLAYAPPGATGLARFPEYGKWAHAASRLGVRLEGGCKPIHMASFCSKLAWPIVACQTQLGVARFLWGPLIGKASYKLGYSFQEGPLTAVVACMALSARGNMSWYNVVPILRVINTAVAEWCGIYLDWALARDQRTAAEHIDQGVRAYERQLEERQYKLSLRVEEDASVRTDDNTNRAAYALMADYYGSAPWEAREHELALRLAAQLDRAKSAVNPRSAKGPARLDWSAPWWAEIFAAEDANGFRTPADAPFSVTDPVWFATWAPELGPHASAAGEAVGGDF